MVPWVCFQLCHVHWHLGFERFGSDLQLGWLMTSGNSEQVPRAFPELRAPPFIDEHGTGTW